MRTSTVSKQATREESINLNWLAFFQTIRSLSLQIKDMDDVQDQANESWR